MDNQHRKISGYRELSQEEIDLMNEAKSLAETVGDFIQMLERVVLIQNAGQGPDPRWLAIGKTDLQKGFMAVVRSIAKPTTF